MRFSLQSRKIVFTALGLVVFNVLAMWGRALLNIQIGPTPLWADVLFGFGLILLSLIFFPKLPASLQKSKIALGVSLGMLVLAMLTGLLYAFVYTKYATTNLFLGFFDQLGLWLVDFSLGQSTGWQITLTFTVLSLATLLILAAIKIIWVWRKPFYIRFGKLIYQWDLSKFWRLGRIYSFLSLVAVVLIALGTLALFVAGNAPLFQEKLPYSAQVLSAPPNLVAIYSFAVSNNGDLYIGTDNGVFQSRDDGKNWRFVGKGLPNGAIKLLVWDNKNNVLYVGLENSLVDFMLSSVFRTTDGGASWQPISFGNSDLDKYALIVDKQTGTLYSGTSKGILRSTDMGNSWQDIGPESTNSDVKMLTINNQDGTLFAATGQKYWGVNDVFSSKDNGVSWQLIYQVTNENYVNAIAINSQTGFIYIGTEKGILRSKDNGNHWQIVNNGLTDTSISTLWLDSKDSILYAKASNNIFYLKDDGENWQLVNISLPKAFNILESHNGILYAGENNNLYKSDNGAQSWQLISTGLTKIKSGVNAFATDKQRGILYIGTDHGVFRSKDGGKNWQPASVGLAITYVAALVIDERDGTLYANTGHWMADEAIFRSKDGAQTWEIISKKLPQPFNTLVIDKDGILYVGTGSWAYLGRSGIYRSSDGGDNWQIADSGITTRFEIFNIRTNKDKGTLYTWTSDGMFSSSDQGRSWQLTGVELTNPIVLINPQQSSLYIQAKRHLFRSTDNGTSWQLSEAELSPGQMDNFMTGADGSLYMGMGCDLYCMGIKGLFRSKNGGESWQSIEKNLQAQANGATLVLDYRNNILYVGTTDGVFSSQDGGDHWENIGLANENISTLVQDNHGTLYAGTDTWLTPNNESHHNVFRSINGGHTWESINAGLKSYYGNSLTIGNRDNTVYVETSNGTFALKDGADSWQITNSQSPDFEINVSLPESLKSILYPKTGKAILYLQDSGKNWQLANTETPDITINEYVYEKQSQNIFTYTSAGVFHSLDDGKSWQPANSGLTDTNISALVVHPKTSVLFVGTGKGVFRSGDVGKSWQLASEGLDNWEVRALTLDPQNHTLYADTAGDVYVSEDGENSWQSINANLMEANLDILAIDKQNGILYAATNPYDSTGSVTPNDDSKVSSIFRSNDDGANWQFIGAGLPGSNVKTLIFDSKSEILYVVTDGDIFHSSDSGESWRSVNSGLAEYVNILEIDNRDNSIYAGTEKGVFRSQDRGETWVAAGLPNTNVTNLVMESVTGRLYAWTGKGVFRSKNGGQNWNIVKSPTNTKDLVIDRRDGSLYVTTDDDNVFHSWDGGETWEMATLAYKVPEWILALSPDNPTSKWFMADFNANILKTLSTKPGESILFTWGATNLQITPTQTWPDAWRYLSAWTQFEIKPRLKPYLNNIYIGILAIIFVYIILAYLAFGRKLKIPLWSFLIALSGYYPENFVNKASLDEVWPKWAKIIRAELVRFGNAIPVDLLGIPHPFRKYALFRYVQEFENVFSIQVNGQQARLMTAASLNVWNRAWGIISDELEQRAGLSAGSREQVHRLGMTLGEMLGFTLRQANETQSTCTWLVDAPTLRLNVPQSFHLVFIVDPRPNENTVRTLVDTVSILQKNSYFALVVPLEPETPEVDIPQSLRQAIEASAYAHDFIVLGHNDVLDILMARTPETALVRYINRQVDLSYISPFIVNGPVPSQMFFGRDQEIRNLVDHAGKLNFAIVGNRKIGKTSLINRVESLLAPQEKVRLFRLDCQAMRSEIDFYTAFESIAGLKPDSTLTGFAANLRTLSREGLPILFMLDEIDALLKLQETKNENLISIWRELANEHTCTFLLCGSKVLGRRLRDPESALFNFPEIISLSYLRREEVDEIIFRPLETLGIVTQDNVALAEAIWALSSGHPNLTQYVGKALVTAANARQERTVSQDDVESLWVDADFVQFYFDTIWGAADPLEKLITLLMPASDFSVGDVEKAVSSAGAQVSAAQVDLALEILLVYSVLGRSGKLYRFIPRAFHKLLELNYEKERLLTRELEKLNGGTA